MHARRTRQRKGGVLILDTEAVTKTFFRRTVNERVALSDISLHLDPGDSVTIIGSNGAEKSTLFNIVSSRCQADAGRMKIEGEDVTKLPDHKVVKYVSRTFQDSMAGTAPHLLIEENLALAWSQGRGRTLGPVLTQKKRQMFRDVLAPLEQGLENRLHAKVGLPSGGQRQALPLTMVTFSKSKVLLLDEHIVAPDPKRATLITQITREAVEHQHLIALMITHNMEQVLPMGNRFIVVHEGRTIFELADEEKRRATVTSLLAELDKLHGKEEQGPPDRVLLA